MNTKQITIISTILAITILGYGFMNYTSEMKVLNHKREVLEQEQKENLRMEMMYTSCVTATFDDYGTNWNSYCEGLGREEDCTLPIYKAEVLNDVLKTDKANCVKLFK